MARGARQLRWFQTHADGQSVTSGGQSNNELLTTLGKDIRRGSTITRMILYLMLRPQSTNTLGSVKFGVVSVTEDAATANAFPDADIAGDEADWLYRGAAHALMSNLLYSITRI